MFLQMICVYLPQRKTVSTDVLDRELIVANGERVRHDITICYVKRDVVEHLYKAVLEQELNDFLLEVV